MDEEKRQSLSEMIDAATLLLDDELYSRQSFLALLEAIAYGKAVLADGRFGESDVDAAAEKLCEALDAMELREEAEKREKACTPLWRRLAPYALYGVAALVGVAVLFRNILERKPK